MDQKSDQINLEYKVEFEDGLKQRVYVYGIDSEAGKFYGSHALIGILVGADLDEKSLQYKHMTAKNAALLANEANVKKLILTHFSGRYKTTDDIEKDSEISIRLESSIVGLPHMTKIPEDKNWEQKMYDAYREQNTNVIKVQSFDHVKPALDRHHGLYVEQVRELAETFSDLFKKFIDKYPGL